MSHALPDLPPLREVIARHGLSANKALGQNFLLDGQLLDRIARVPGNLAGQTVYEVGPGPGGLTRALLSEGAEKVQMPIRVGRRWVGSFENPALKKCTVESFGYQILVSGPERDVVFARSQQFRERGAQIVRGPVKEGRVWRIYLEELDLYEAPRFAVQDAARRAP